MSVSEGMGRRAESKRWFSPIALCTTRHGAAAVISDYLPVSKPNAADMQSLTFVDALMAELKRVSQDDSAI